MINRLEVKGLNNRIDASMNFNEDLNIITGRNGSGKTTLLKLIWYLISGNLERIVPEIPFADVLIETDTFFLTMMQVDVDKCAIDYRFVNGKNSTLDFEVPPRTVDSEKIDALNAQIAEAMQSSLFFPTFRRIEGGFSQSSTHHITDDRVRYRHSNPLRRKMMDGSAEMLQESMSRLSNQVSVFNHKFIASISTNDIVELLTEKYADVSEKTNELYVKLSKEITQKISDTEASDDASPVLADIQKSVEQFTNRQNSLLRPFSVLSKRIRDIFQYEGIRVTTGITLGEVNEAIASDKLSAGEKQMLSFLCYNTFVQNAAIFIDEPELSLHVDWQRLLLPTLLEQDTDNQFFIATHSPFIYSRYPEKEILLGTDRGDS